MPSSFSTGVAVQTTYPYGRGRAMPGERPRANIYGDRPCERCVFAGDDVSQVTSLEITGTTNGNAAAIVIDGASIPFVQTAANNTTAQAAIAALDTAKAGGIFSSVLGLMVDQGGGVFEIRFADAGPHDVSVTGTGFVVILEDSPAGTLAVRAKAGTVACYATAQGDPTLLKCAEPGPSNLRPVGVVARGPYPSGSTPPAAFGLAAGESWPSKVMVSCWQKADVEVLIAGDVTAGGQCYFVATGPGTPNNGYFVGSDGSSAGVAQVTRGTVVPTNGDTVGLVFAEATVNVVSTASAAATALLLASAVNNNADTGPVYFVGVDGNDVVITKKTPGTFTISANSPATADVTGLGTPEVVGSAPVAATAAIYPGARFVETRAGADLTATVDLG